MGFFMIFHPVFHVLFDGHAAYLVKGLKRAQHKLQLELTTKTREEATWHWAYIKRRQW